MKTTICTIFILVALNSGMLFADGVEVKAVPEVLVSQIAPVTPKEADFEDPATPEVSEDVASLTPATLAPTPPVEADFME